MALDKIIVLIFTTIFLIYGYTSFYEMDNLLPPILKMNPVWPSTFPKFISILGLIICFLILIKFEKTKTGSLTRTQTAPDKKSARSPVPCAG